MNLLEKYLIKLDNSSYDCRDDNTINTEFQQVCKQLYDEGNKELADIGDIDRLVFSVQKSFDTKLDVEKGTVNGLSWQMSGNRTLDDGSQVPFYWPDVANFTQQNYEYFEKRYNECKNLYAKTEYGLMVYFGEKTVFSKHNDFKKQLCSELFLLTNDYFSKAERGGEKNYYIMDFFNTLQLAFGVAEKSKIEPELHNIIQYIFSIHQNWDITKDDTLRILLDLSGLMSDNFTLFNSQINFQHVLDKNMLGAKELEKTYIWGAMYAIDRNIAIEQKRKNAVTSLLDYKAKLYEKLSLESDSKNNLAAVSFTENALRIYQQLKDTENVKRMEKIYSDLRGKFKLSEIRQEFPKEHIDQAIERIIKAVAENDELGIIKHFILTPWYDTIESISSQSIKISKQTVLLSKLSTEILDKFGNTVDVYNTEEEKRKYGFWSTYTLGFQIGTQTMHSFFIEAYKAGKLNLKSVLAYLESTWFNDVIVRNYHGHVVEIKPIDTLKPALIKLFEEIDKYFANNNYQCDFVTVTDSLTLKVEGLLRYFCEKIGIATFKTRQKGSDKLVMEKLLDDLLADIAHKPASKPEQETNFNEEDRIFIKYVMSEKVGLNMRNKVAHSLMDISEYSFQNVLVLFCTILKLSKYKFTDEERSL